MTESSSKGSAEPRITEATAEVARRYAAALVSAAQNEGGVEPVMDELAEIERDILKAFPKFAAMLASASGIRRSQRPDSHRGLGQAGVGPGHAVPAGTLNRHDRLGMLWCRGPGVLAPFGIAATSAFRLKFARRSRSMKNSCKHFVTGSPL